MTVVDVVDVVAVRDGRVAAVVAVDVLVPVGGQVPDRRHLRERLDEATQLTRAAMDSANQFRSLI